MLPDPLRIEISGVPHPQPRPRFVKGQGVVSTIAPRVKRWRLLVHMAAVDAAQAVGEAEIEQLNRFPLSVDFEFRLPHPAGKAAWIGSPHWHRPDRDNLEKAVMDELQAARILDDDGRVAAGSFRKIWCRPCDAGCTVVLTAMPAPREGRPAKDEAPGWLDAGQGAAGD